MSYYRSMPISQLIAGLNDANELVTQGNMSDEDMDALTDRLTAEVQMLTSLDDERERLEQEGIGQQDLHRLEKISPGVTVGLNSGDYTFLASQQGLEPALNAIDWKAVGAWGIVGAIIAAIIALIIKIKGGRDKGKEKIDIVEAIKQDYEQTQKRINNNIHQRMDTMASNNAQTDKVFRDLKIPQPAQKPKTAAPSAPPKVFNKDKAVKALQERFKNSEAGVPTEREITSSLPIREFQTLSASDTVGDEAMGKIYSFCFHFALNEQNKKGFLGFDNLYGKEIGNSTAKIMKILSNDLISSDVIENDLSRMIDCVSRLNDQYKDGFTHQDYQAWIRDSDGKSVSFGGIVEHISQIVVSERTDGGENDVKGIVDGIISLSLASIVNNPDGGFYNFKDIAKPSYVAGNNLRHKVLKHLDVVEKDQKGMAAKVKQYEDLSKELNGKLGKIKSSDADKLVQGTAKSIQTLLVKGNSAITSHHRNALASVRGCSEYIRYGDVGIEIFKILSKNASSVIDILLDSFEKPGA